MENLSPPDRGKLRLSTDNTQVKPGSEVSCREAGTADPQEKPRPDSFTVSSTLAVCLLGYSSLDVYLCNI